MPKEGRKKHQYERMSWNKVSSEANLNERVFLDFLFSENKDSLSVLVKSWLGAKNGPTPNTNYPVPFIYSILNLCTSIAENYHIHTNNIIFKDYCNRKTIIGIFAIKFNTIL